MSLESIFNHLVLPPKLPGREDSNLDEINRQLTTRLLKAVDTLRDSDDEFFQTLDSISRSIKLCEAINEDGWINKSALMNAFPSVQHSDAVILHISGQNAGLLIRPETDKIVFEAFEASPVSEDVLASKAALEWDFPGSAVAMSLRDFVDPNFQEAIADFLGEVSSQTFGRFAASTKKAGKDNVEVRDTTDPALVTQLLMNLLEPQGCRVFPPLLRKRVYDNVCWDNSEIPWRRSPFWLVLRVSLQRLLCLSLGDGEGRVHYKFILCLVLAKLLDESLAHPSLETPHLLKAKLCRRLGKLESERSQAFGSLHEVYGKLFAALEPCLRASVLAATNHIEVKWRQYRKDIQRPIPKLPLRVGPLETRLLLRNSGEHLGAILDEFQRSSRMRYISSEARDYEIAVRDYMSKAPMHQLFTRYMSLAGLNCAMVRFANETQEVLGYHPLRIVSDNIHKFLDEAHGAFDSCPEQMSSILLTVFRLWMAMDECTTRSFPLLKEYHPGFEPEILDVLQLSRLEDMVSLRTVQEYVMERCKHSGRATIFADPGLDCFAYRFVQESPSMFRAHQQRVEQASEAARSAKEREWRRLDAEYSRFTSQIAVSTCTLKRNPDGSHDIKGCSQCYFRRQRKRLRIDIHEEFLPNEDTTANMIQKQAIIFEMAIPMEFAMYREATWRILSTLCRPKGAMTSETPRVLLKDHPPLQIFMPMSSGNFALGSKTKSFLVAHYKSRRFPASLDDVIKPLGLNFSYYDSRLKGWASDLTTPPTLVHHCLFSAQKTPFTGVDHLTGPTSYEIISNQTKCPSALTQQEFAAYQSLLTGKAGRWMTIIRELGSTNLNFSSEATMNLINQLALQAGPTHESDVLRVPHVTFRDTDFCDKLFQLLNQKLDGLFTNWRETHCLELLTTLTLRLCTLGDDLAKNNGLRLLTKVRTVTLNWILRLRAEVSSASDADSAKRAAQYAFGAALLCRRTFSANCDLDIQVNEEALKCFVEASIALQENAPSDPSSLPLALKNMLLRDVYLSFRITHRVRQAIRSYPAGLASAIETVWPLPEGSPHRAFAQWKFLQPPDDEWVMSTVQDDKLKPQTVHYNFVQGHLTVDSKPLGKLPADVRDSEIVKMLFGNQHLLSVPSNVPGMLHALVTPLEDHVVHIGYRGGQLMLRALYRSTTLELISSSMFGHAHSLDLPASLVNDCVHWLDLKSGIMDIRRKPAIWRANRPANWALDIRNCRARRRDVLLVEPSCPVAQDIVGIFKHFAAAQDLTIYQRQKRGGTLSVDIKHFDLRFNVNHKQLLQSRQLTSEIDPDQDAGVFYGLQSKIVLRDIANPLLRSIILPLGTLDFRRTPVHVSSRIMSTAGVYARFNINAELQRLECPPEPRLLYTKAELHAYTSFFLPDPLTGRTGAEEALHCLHSGLFQPWSSTEFPIALTKLLSIAKLTPLRKYYPRGLKRQQEVGWNENLTASVQHESYLPAVAAIYSAFERLSALAEKDSDKPQTELSKIIAGYVSHLGERASAHQSRYERPHAFSGRYDRLLDVAYQRRDNPDQSKQGKNVYDVAFLLCNPPPAQLRTTLTLAAQLSKFTLIQGHHKTYDATIDSSLSADLALSWGSLVELCRKSRPEQKHRLIFVLGTIAFRNDIDMNLIKTLLAFSIFDELKDKRLPEFPTFMDFKPNEPPTEEVLTTLVSGCHPPYTSSDVEEHDGYFKLSAKMRKARLNAPKAYEAKCAEENKRFVGFLLRQWPCRCPSSEGFDAASLEVYQAIELIKPEWLRLWQNLQFSQHLDDVQGILKARYTRVQTPQPQSAVHDVEYFRMYFERMAMPSLSPNFLSACGTIHATGLPGTSGVGIARTSAVETPFHRDICKILPADHMELDQLLSRFSHTESPLRKRYAQDMKQSLVALSKTDQESNQPRNEPPPHRELADAQTSMQQRLEGIQLACSANDPRSWWLTNSGLWPCISPVTLLEQLRSTSELTISENVKRVLIDYALSITAVQRLLRIKAASTNYDRNKINEERANVGHENWSPLQYPDWLLLEIDANILLRKEQVDVALATISPTSGSNSVVQMQMGQGKTSCIIPMVAAVLADGTQLTRIIVPKTLLLQTAQILQSRLGGLLGRTIKHVPFSRLSPSSPDVMQAYHSLHQEVLASSGVILALPEHILSFFLCGRQRLSDYLMEEAAKMVQIQSWFDSVSRDVLDESDYTLAVRTQLIYPSGSLKTVDGHPHRWITAQSLLRMVHGHLEGLQKEYPRSVQVVSNSAKGFPVLHFLRRDVEDALLARLVNDIVDGRLPVLPIQNCAAALRKAIKSFLSEEQVDSSVASAIARVFPDNPAAMKCLFLLRGLLVHRILLLCLKKRWNFQYGLHPNRDPIAVPFTAKGVPSDQAEWGHPDVAILFTCLAFYYSGLTLDQLREGLQHVLKSDDPASEYDRWTHGAISLPHGLQHWNAINIDDEGQIQEIWSHLRFTVTVIDHFLNHFVFPRHATQFAIKLQASGWDLPLFLGSKQAKADGTREKRTSRALTTGFSGTNDNRRMLPLTIQQDDLPGLSHTNAQVLAYLLQSRNRSYVLAATQTGQHISEKELLIRLRGKGIRILIDAGALILEMDNHSLAREWLQIDTQAQAAVYFDNKSKPWVLYRNNKRLPLLATPFANNLEECVVYLDEAHTRGTDLKLPPKAKGALTLGLGQTKDQTVQAAMRLRQLGTTQSVTFFAPPEVHQSILDLRSDRNTDRIDSSDVVYWLLEQTCNSNEQLQKLYCAQGLDFCRRVNAGKKNSDFLTSETHRDNYLRVLRQPEQQSLQQMYKPTSGAKTKVTVSTFCSEVRGFVDQLVQQRDVQTEWSTTHTSALEQVEQEREVANEVQQVRQVQKPVHFKPFTFPGLHPTIRSFAATGKLRSCTSYIPAYAILCQTELGMKHEVILGPDFEQRRLFVSAQFMRTVELKGGQLNDNFIRPVNWILWCPSTQTALVVIPEEAEELIPIVRKANHAQVHLVIYSAPVTKRMLHFNDLTFYSLPSLRRGWKAPLWLRIHLGILAGRLYFEFEEHGELTRVLGLGDDPVDAHRGSQIDRADDGETRLNSRLRSFVQDWLAIRRNGQDFTHTPMGYLCQGWTLRPEHPFFTESTQSEAERLVAGVDRLRIGRSNPNAEVDYDSGDEDYESEHEEIDDGEDGLEDGLEDGAESQRAVDF
ncbi:hypothetical protein EJ06DRAFT_222752 [Trichodelitschia bisporula]|uniref:ubiquitinyl hydrolase 1 n=1 Tax=Trichodelitschia bisporula TaxID=703511 RepID=A0A6G1HKK3_9PEZI|nr:hypothetical protein EJ06DRAFT_222752 [Trichodelitschia bisporula]